MWSASPGTPWTSVGAGSSSACMATVAAPMIRSTTRGGPCTGEGLLTGKQRSRLVALFIGDVHIEVEATWGSTSG